MFFCHRRTHFCVRKRNWSRSGLGYRADRTRFCGSGRGAVCTKRTQICVVLTDGPICAPINMGIARKQAHASAIRGKFGPYPILRACCGGCLRDRRGRGPAVSQLSSLKAPECGDGVMCRGAAGPRAVPVSAGKKACFPKAWRMDTCIRRTHFCEGGGVDAGETVPVSAESAACRSVPISACCAAEMGTLCCLPLFRGRRNGYAAGIAAGKGAGRFASGRRRLYASVPVSADAVAEMGTLTGGECAPSFAFAEMGTLFPLARPAGRPGRRAPPGVRGTWVSGIMRSPGVGRLAAGHHVFHDL